jgi:DNA repair protein RadC
VANVTNNEAEVALGQRSTRDLLAMVLRREHEHGLLHRAGGIELLAEAEPIEIAEWLEAKEKPPRARPSSVGPSSVSPCSISPSSVGPASAPRLSGTVLKSANAVAAAFELGRRAEIARAKIPERFDSAEKVAEWARPRLAYLPHEELWLLALDGRGHARATRCLARGGIHGAAVRAADPLRVALRVGASAFVLVHNHPSGDPTPSKEDVMLTMRVAEAARIVGIVLLDHIVVSKGGFSCVPDPDDE